MVKFTASKFEAELIGRIVDRAIEVSETFGNKIDRMSLLMDIEAVHCNGNPLNLADLYMSDQFNFVHDVFGIMRHIDRKTGKLKDFFSPRYSL